MKEEIKRERERERETEREREREMGEGYPELLYYKCSRFLQ